MSNFGVHIVNESRIILFAIDEGKSVHHLHQCTISVITCCASSLQSSDRYAHLLVSTLQSKYSYTLVGFLHVGNKCCQAQLGNLCRIFVLKVCDKVHQKTGLLVELVGGVNLVVLDVLCENLCSLCHVCDRHSKECFNGFLVASIECVTVVVCLGDVIGQKTLLRNFQNFVLC